MFDITHEDINQLNDIDLRELVGRLCEAELVSRGLSPSAVTWGGNQTAPDGGLDVRVALSPGLSIDGFVPRLWTGFQVKKPDMPRNAILSEMRPKCSIRPVIQELADVAGAYIIVSSSGSTADSALRDRQNALREGLEGVGNAGQLHTDFYDRTRLATWVRRYPGLITWVKEKIGRTIVGWRPYNVWAGGSEDIDAEYLLDEKLRLKFSGRGDSSAQSLADAIDELRDELAQLGKIVRLVGLSGVGKTRLAQSLFDVRIGARPLPPYLAVYTNLSDNPDPQPTGLASDLLANRTRAVLIIDNCPPDLHRRLSDLCSGQPSTVSVLTIEYDVRDDQPEGTQVVTLETSSAELIEKLIRRRYLNLSQVDARTIAEASGGNARIAIALAETVGHSDTIAGLSNEELFQRLFRQRQDSNDALLLAAKACSLLYSFQGEAWDGEEAELPCLAVLAGQSTAEMYRHVGELLRRDLAQQRGVWRAVLPHAIANRLAAHALEDIPYALINQHFIKSGTKRLAQSFSRRLSFLHDHPKAVGIVEKWLAPDGLLGDLKVLNSVGRAMFANIAPVLPEATLVALEGAAAKCRMDVDAMEWRHHLPLLRSLAYDQHLFERSSRLLAMVATQSTDKQEAKEASDTFVSLFTIYLSGTHATIEQRLCVIDQLLRSVDSKTRALGLAALSKVLATTRFSSSFRFEFGARSRDYGYQPKSDADITRWYSAALMLLERLALSEGFLKPELSAQLASHFSGLWSEAQMHIELERLSRRFAADGFWRDGWAACRKTMKFNGNRMTPETTSLLSSLATYLRPSNLSERVRALVLGGFSGSIDFEDMDVEDDPVRASEQAEAIILGLGAAVVTDNEVFQELLPELFCVGNRVWGFGRGLASAAPDIRATWVTLIEGLEGITLARRGIGVLKGFLAEIWDRDRGLAQDLLDFAFDKPTLLEFLPELQSAVELDARGTERLKRLLNAGKVPVCLYKNLAYGGTTNNLAIGSLSDLLLLIADQPEGFEVALEILSMRLFANSSAQRQHEPELLDASRYLLQRVRFQKNQRDDYNLSCVIKACLWGTGGGEIAAVVAMRLRQALLAHETYSFDNTGMLKALLELQPTAVLDALLQGNKNDTQAGIDAFMHIHDHLGNPLDVVPCEELIAWCEGDPERRYLLAASIVTFAVQPEESGPQIWSEQANAVLARAPDPKRVLEVFIKRFRPMIWSGSRAALIEANARLLESLESHLLFSLMPFVTEAKSRLAQEVAEERLWETKKDQTRDERFE